MHAAHVGSIVVRGSGGEPVGILTLRDVLPRTPVEQPVSRVMTPEPMRVDETVPAYEAAALMAHHGFSHVCVVRDGVLTGVLSERDLFAMQRVGLSALVRAISTAPSTERLVEASGRVEVLIDQLLAQGVQAEPLMRIITDLNDHTTRRAIELCVAAQDVPPPPFTWLSFGSEGRREQTLRTDQDNGMLFRCGDSADADAMRERLLPLARQINETLAACGFILCPGNIMASNPECCLSEAEWRQRFRAWLDGGVPEHLLNAAIFFDFRGLYGDAAPAEALRDWLTRHARRARVFLRLMAQNALRNRPPLGLVRDFAVERGGEYPDTVDLKLQGATPFVDGARILALAHGIAATNTQARLAGLAETRAVPAEDPAAWTESFDFLQLLRMRLHRQQARRGEALHNHLNPDQLNPLERRILKEVFRQARKLQDLLALNHQL
jgi:CBS domain-containing protein